LLRRPDAQLPPANRPRMARKRHPQARAQTLAGLWLLEQALQHAGLRHMSTATLFIDANDRPCFATGPVFSIAHSEHWVACALVEPDDPASRVGLDLEQYRVIPLARMKRLSLSEHHAAIEHDPARCFDFWRARQATVKATGGGRLRRVRQSRLGGGSTPLDERGWVLGRVQLAHDVAACL